MNNYLSASFIILIGLIALTSPIFADCENCKPYGMAVVEDPDAYPYDSIFYLCRYSEASKSEKLDICHVSCTGFLLDLRDDPDLCTLHGRVLITAGHCLSGADWIDIIPRKIKIRKYKKDGASEYDLGHREKSIFLKTFWREVKWKENSPADYGILLLEESIATDATGLKIAKKAPKKNDYLEVAGFPNKIDKDNKEHCRQCEQKMFHSTGKRLNPDKESRDWLISHTAKAAGGISGAPVWNKNKEVVGIHIGYGKGCKQRHKVICTSATSLISSKVWKDRMKEWLLCYKKWD